jgi:hypothetical protein
MIHTKTFSIWNRYGTYLENGWNATVFQLAASWFGAKIWPPAGTRSIWLPYGYGSHMEQVPAGGHMEFYPIPAGGHMEPVFYMEKVLVCIRLTHFPKFLGGLATYDWLRHSCRQATWIFLESSFGKRVSLAVAYVIPFFSHLL